jgi:catechol 2,3-dioxygenase-like lactoylglutathione lyase family enzyme
MSWLNIKNPMEKSNLSLDHIVIAVTDLDSAIEHYRALGFSTFYGGKHADGNTHNALIVLQDGTYIELIAPTDPGVLDQTDSELPTFLHFFKMGEGFAGFALLCDDIDAEVRAMRSRGLAIDDPRDGGRQRPDGQQLAWRVASVGGNYSPFLITDLTPRGLRVPDDADKITHENKVAGTIGLVVLVEDLTKSTQRYEALLGAAPEPGSPLEGAETLKFSLRNCALTIAAPADESGVLSGEFSRRGEAPYLLGLKTSDMSRAGVLDITQTHGARIELG